jgi:hypothetical protein
MKHIWKRNSYEVLVGKHEGQRPRHRWEGNIKISLKEIGWEGVERFYLPQDKTSGGL